MDGVIIREAQRSDLPRLLEIYTYYVKHTAITFDYEVPSREAFAETMDRVCEKYPYLVLEQAGRVQGYAYARPFVGRAAYEWSCEMTIYLDPNAVGHGLGRRLYEALEARLSRMGILNLYACIGYPEREDEYLTKNSASFHAHMGFTKVGTFHNCGYKFGRWYHMIWMEKIIGTAGDDQAPVIPYPALS